MFICDFFAFLLETFGCKCWFIHFALVLFFLLFSFLLFSHYVAYTVSASYFMHLFQFTCQYRQIFFFHSKQQQIANISCLQLRLKLKITQKITTPHKYVYRTKWNEKPNGKSPKWNSNQIINVIWSDCLYIYKFKWRVQEIASVCLILLYSILLVVFNWSGSAIEMKMPINNNC